MANQVEPSKAAGGIKGALMRLIRRAPEEPIIEPQDPPALRIAGYNLVLLDSDGQVAWTREWNAGGAFDFGPRWNLWVFCEFTNQTRQEIEIAEYEIELMNDEGQVVERYGTAFADSVIVAPGETRVFSGQWRL